MRCALAPLLAASFVASSASAEPSPPRGGAELVVHSPDCSPVALDVGELARLLRIELSGDGVDTVTIVDVAAARDDPALVHLRLVEACGDASRLGVAIDDGATHKRLERTVDLAALEPAVRPRALALAVAELLRASWVELLLPSASTSRDTVSKEVLDATTARVADATSALPARVVPAARGADEAVARRTFVSVGAEGRLFLGVTTGMLGGRATASLPLPWRSVRLRADGGAWRATATHSLGDVELWLATGALGLSLGAGTPRVDGEIGPRIEVGWAAARGTPTADHVIGASTGGLVAVPSMVATGRMRIASRWWAVADVDLGHVLRPLTATASGGALLGVDGATGGVRLGVALGL